MTEPLTYALEAPPPEPTFGHTGGDDAPIHSQWQLFRRRFFRHRMAVVSLIVLGLLATLCFLSPWIAPHELDWHNDFLINSAPSSSNWFGTNDSGGDILSLTLYGGKISLTIGLAVALFSTLIGTVVGAASAWFAGAVDGLLMRLTDLFLVIPQLAILAIGLRWIAGTEASPSLVAMIVVLVAVFWMPIARIVRGQVLSLKEKEFVEAARASGAGPIRIIVFHVLPNCLGPIMVAATVTVAAAILTEAALSFLTLGLKPPNTSWGVMVADAHSAGAETSLDKWYELVFPCAAIIITVLAINFIGDALRDALDPQGSR